MTAILERKLQIKEETQLVGPRVEEIELAIPKPGDLRAFIDEILSDT